jgi:RNA polymerase sigma-70 factor (ECF subfamily)
MGNATAGGLRVQEDRQVSERCFRLKPKLEQGGEAELVGAIAKAKAGENEGYRYLYSRYSDNIFSYVRQIVHDDHDAEDITQQVFAKLFTAIKRYEPRSVPFSAWILRVARNAAIDHIRSDRLIPCEEVRGADQLADEVSDERRRSLTDALGLLPRAQREVVVMRHLVGLTPSEIAGRLGKSESAIHGLHHRGRRSLQRELVKSGSAPALVPA